MRPSWDHRDPATGLPCLHLPTQEDSSDSEEESEWKDDEKTHPTYFDCSDIEEDNEASLGDNLTPTKIPAAAPRPDSPTMYQIEQVVRGLPFRHFSFSSMHSHILRHCIAYTIGPPEGPNDCTPSKETCS